MSSACITDHLRMFSAVRTCKGRLQRHAVVLLRTFLNEKMLGFVENLGHCARIWKSELVFNNYKIARYGGNGLYCVSHVRAISRYVHVQ
jgi:hypothetical protein